MQNINVIDQCLKSQGGQIDKHSEIYFTYNNKMPNSIN